MDCRLKIKVVDWQDRAFVRAFDVSLADALRDGLDIDRATVADRAEAELRGEGYPAARISYTRSVDEVLTRVAHWTVWRDGTALENDVSR